MIVWGGGIGGPSLFNTGGKYNPGTDSWTATSTINAPSARVGHTAVWTGSEMIVWGGITLGGYLNTGGRYNPTTDTWIATSTSNAPSGRYDHTAVWTRSEMIVWGGIDDSGLGTPAADIAANIQRLRLRLTRRHHPPQRLARHLQQHQLHHCH